MTPFLRFRLWTRRAPVGERVAAAVAAVLAAALIGWILQPTGGEGVAATGVSPVGVDGSPTTVTTVVAGSAQASGTPGASTAGPAGAAVTPGAAAPAGSGARAAGTAVASACANLSSTDQGVTAGEIKVAVLVGDLQGQIGNSLIGLPSPDTEEAYFQAAIDYANKHGGTACRKIVPKFYRINLLDASQAHAQCLAVIQEQVFAAIDTGLTYVAGERDCLAKAKIPFLTIGLLYSSEIRDYYPYVYSWWGRWDVMMLDYVLGSKELGFFDPAQGFKKLGVTTQNCTPELNDQFFAALKRFGIDRGQVSVFNYGCPTGLVLPNQISQAVLQFQTDGVTHVMDTYTHSQNDFSKQAQRQNYHPRYSVADGGEVTTFETASFAPDPDNFDGSIAISMQQAGAIKSGVPLSAGTKRCDDAAVAAGTPKPAESPVAYMGAACNGVFMFQAMASKTAPLTRANLVNGLAQVGDLPFSFPAGPATFKDNRTVVGGHAWRGLRFEKDCRCFKIVDATWRPNYT